MLWSWMMAFLCAAQVSKYENGSEEALVLKTTMVLSFRAMSGN